MTPTEIARFWVFGPISSEDGETLWAVVDGEDLSGRRRAIKPRGYSEFWPTEYAAREHAAYMNLPAEEKQQ